MNIPLECDRCTGTGQEPSEAEEQLSCFDCNGTGEIIIEEM